MFQSMHFNCEPILGGDLTHGTWKFPGWIGAAAAGLHHSNVRSEPYLQPTLQLATTQGPLFLLIDWLHFRAAPVAYRRSQARGRTRAAAAGLGHSHSSARSKLHLQSTPQLMAMPDS